MSADGNGGKKIRKMVIKKIQQYIYSLAVFAIKNLQLTGMQAESFVLMSAI